MSKRMQVLVDEAEFQRMQASARAQGLTLAEWVRQELRVALQRRSTGDAERKLKTVRSAVRHQFPTADIDQMLGEIEQGYVPER